MFFENVNFLNYPVIRFKKSSMKNLQTFYETIYQKFKTDEDEGEKWKDKCYEALIDGDDKKLEELKKERGRVLFVDEVIDILIDNFTKEGGISEEEKQSHRETILKSKYIKDIEYKENPAQIVFHTKIGTFKASKLSDVFPIFKKFPGIETDERHGTCHSSAIDVSTTISDKNKVATGYFYTFGEGCKYLHSWIELKIGTRMFVIDTTRNLLMPRKGYYYIRNITGPVYKISSKTLKKEEYIRDKLCGANEWLNKLYLSNRHQAKAVYKMIIDEEERKKLEDPLYVAAKHFHDSMIAAQKKEKNKKTPKIDKKATEPQKG